MFGEWGGDEHDGQEQDDGIGDEDLFGADDDDQQPPQQHNLNINNNQPAQIPFGNRAPPAFLQRRQQPDSPKSILSLSDS